MYACTVFLQLGRGWESGFKCVTHLSTTAQCVECALTAAPFCIKKFLRKVSHLCHLVENKLHIKDQDCVIIFVFLCL